ncbi:MAG TPA: hypothetical protein VNT03_09690 [Baekduia sp.]|nr:hypothetical protein [Baekduia sp.]
MRTIVATVLGLALLAVPAHASSELGAARAATARYHVQHAGYSLLKDAAGIACIDKPGVGGMGIHYVNGDLVADGQIDATTPELLVYEPEANGRERLVAAEYVVFQSDWDAAHTSRPELFGQEFELTPAGNRYGLPAFYELHAWLWKHNPAGMFDDWNPRVVCPSA